MSNPADSHARVRMEPIPEISRSQIMTPAEALELHRSQPFDSVLVFRRVAKRGRARNVYTVHESVSVLKKPNAPRTPYRRIYRVADWTGNRAGARALARRIADALYEDRAPEVGPNRDP